MLQRKSCWPRAQLVQSRSAHSLLSTLSITTHRQATVTRPGMDARAVGRYRVETAHPTAARSAADGALITAAHRATPYRAALASRIAEAVRPAGLSSTVFVDPGSRLFFGARRRSVTSRTGGSYSHLSGNTPSVPSLDNVEGYHRIGYPRCERIEQSKSDPIGGSRWNTSGGNCDGSIRRWMRRRACMICSRKSAGGRRQCTEKIARCKSAKARAISCTVRAMKS